MHATLHFCADHIFEKREYRVEGARAPFNTPAGNNGASVLLEYR